MFDCLALLGVFVMHTTLMIDRACIIFILVIYNQKQIGDCQNWVFYHSVDWKCSLMWAFFIICESVRVFKWEKIAGIRQCFWCLDWVFSHSCAGLSSYLWQVFRLGCWDNRGFLHLAVGFLHRASGWGRRHLDNHLQLETWRRHPA